MNERRSVGWARILLLILVTYVFTTCGKEKARPAQPPANKVTEDEGLLFTALFIPLVYYGVSDHHSFRSYETKSSML